LRRSPTVWSEPERKLAAGAQVLILSGPVQADGYPWWQVRLLPDGPEGWLVENPDWFEQIGGGS
jgi:hypothetical protein